MAAVCVALAGLVPLAGGAGSLTVHPGSKLNIGYLRSGRLWVLTNEVSGAFVFSNITHLIEIGGNGVNPDGSVTVGDVNSLTNYASAAHASGKKISICISDTYTSSGGSLGGVIANAALSATLVTNLLQICQQYNLDGVDFDWEQPISSELANYAAFFQQLRAAAPRGLLISAAIGWWNGVVPAAAAPSVDWFFVMAYSDCSPQVNYASAVADMTAAVVNGLPAPKLVLGLPIYGATTNCATAGYAGIIGAAILDPSLDAYNGWSFNGPTTISNKTQYVYANGYAGIGWWDLSLDTYDRRSLLLAAANQSRASAFANAVVWNGGGNGTWDDGNDWTGDAPPATNQDVFFGLGSTSQWATVLTSSRAVDGFMLYEAPAPISISGQMLTLGAGGIDMQWSTQNAVFSNALALSAAQTWSVANARTLTVSGNVSGSGPLIKAGWGALQLNGANIWSGGTTISAGALQLGDGTSGHDGSVSGNIINHGALVFNLFGYQSYAGTISGIGSLTKAGAGTLDLQAANVSGVGGGLAINGGIVLRYGGFVGSGHTVSANSNATYYATAGGQTINDNFILNSTAAALRLDSYWSGTDTFAGTITLSQPNSGILAYNGAGGAGSFAIIFNGQITGGGGLNLRGLASGGVLPAFTLANTANSYTGPTIITGCTLTLGGSGTLGGGTYSGAISNNGTLVINSSVAQVFLGNISGTGSLVKNGPAALYMGNTTNTYSGNTVISAGYLEVHDGALILSNSVLDVTSTDARAVDIWAGKLIVRGLTGTGQLAANGAYANGASWWWNLSSDKVALSINVPSAESYSFGGVLKNASWSSGVMAVEKNGPGTESFTGNNTYTGVTLVNGGTLFVNGSISTGTVVVNSGATLGGTGVINGAATVQTGGTLAPGNNAIGALTFSNSLSLAGQTVLELGKSGSTLTNDLLTVKGDMTRSGSLLVTNVGATPLAAGDSFTLFNATNATGSFSSTALPPLAPGLAWTNRLAVNGSIQVIQSVNLAATNLTALVTGGTNLSLSWPADHTGWRLLTQTNHLGSGVSANTNDWMTVAGSSATNQVSFPIIITAPAGYYRLVYP